MAPSGFVKSVTYRCLPSGLAFAFFHVPPSLLSGVRVLTEINLRTETFVEPRPAPGSTAARRSGDRFDRILDEVEPNGGRGGNGRDGDDVSKPAAAGKKPAKDDVATAAERPGAVPAEPRRQADDTAEIVEAAAEPLAGAAANGDAQLAEPATEREILWQRLSQLRGESGEPVFSDDAEIDAAVDLLIAARDVEHPAPEFAALLSALQSFAANLLGETEAGGTATTPAATAIATAPAADGAKLADLLARLLARTETTGQSPSAAARPEAPVSQGQMAALQKLAALLTPAATPAETQIPAHAAATAAPRGRPAPLTSPADPLTGRAPSPGAPPAATGTPAEAALNAEPSDKPAVAASDSRATDDADSLLGRLATRANGSAPSSALLAKAASPHGHAGPPPAVAPAMLTDLPAVTAVQSEPATTAMTGQILLGGAAQQSAQMPQTAQPAMLASTVAVDIARFAQRGETRFEIRLDPPELGRVDVRLRVADDGMIRAHLFVERSETLDMFMRDARALERALEQNGLKTPQGGLEFSLGSGGPGGEFAGNGDTGSAPSNDDGTDTIPVDQVATTYHMTLTRDGRVDIRV